MSFTETQPVGHSLGYPRSIWRFSGADFLL